MEYGHSKCATMVIEKKADKWKKAVGRAAPASALVNFSSDSDNVSVSSSSSEEEVGLADIRRRRMRRSSSTGHRGTWHPVAHTWDKAIGSAPVVHNAGIGEGGCVLGVACVRYGHESVR